MISPPKLIEQQLDLNLQAHELTFTLVQPCVADIHSIKAKFTMTETAARDQMQLLKTTLELSTDLQGDFLILPEYSLPSSQLPEIDQLVKDGLRSNGVLLAGLDGISYPDYHRLTTPSQETSVPRGLKNSWVNTGVLWVKDELGIVNRFFQPKLFEANAEASAGGMYRGESLTVFRAGHFRFAFVICRDLICNVCILSSDGQALQVSFAEWLSRQLIEPLDILFVIQLNPKPDEFLEAKRILLHSGKVSAVISINQAEYGRSGFYLRGPYKHPPDQVPFSYSAEIVSSIYRARFRTDQAAVFVAKFQAQESNASVRALLPVGSLEEYLIHKGNLIGSGERVGVGAHIF